MGLPELIALRPLAGLPRAVLTVPGSKSITNRALVAAALGKGTVDLEGALWSEDTRCMVECLRTLGFDLRVLPDPDEASNRTIRVRGSGGRIPRKGGTKSRPLELRVENSGTAARFLMAMVCLGRGCYRLSGVPRMHERPQTGLVDALRELGYRIEDHHGCLPVKVEGGGPTGGSCRVEIAQSSQFASALLLCREGGGWQVQVRDEDARTAPYVRMTRELLQGMKSCGKVFRVEPDASSGSYFWALNALGLPGAGPVSVARWPDSGWQVDAAFPSLMEHPGPLSRERDLGDAIMTAIVLSAAAGAPRRFVDLRRLRVQECERVEALGTELGRLGVRVIEREDTMLVTPAARMTPAVIDTRNDHRMAMCFALLALRHPGVRLRGARCVIKTFPDFFAKLAALPPRGLGAEIGEGESGRRLEGEDLLAR